MKYGKKLILLLLIFLTVSVVMCYKVNPFRGSVNNPKNTLDLSYKLSKKQAIEDIDYVKEIIESRHVSTINGLPSNMSEIIDNKKDSLDDEITVLKLWQIISEMLSTLNDSHTNIKPYFSDDKVLSCDFDMDDKDLYILDNDSSRRRVYSINKVAVQDLYNLFLQSFSYENEYFARTSFCSYIKTYSGLQFLNAISENDAVYFEVESKENKSKISKENYDFINLSDKDIEDVDDVHYSIDPVLSSGILTINKCIADDNYKKNLKNFFSAVKDNNIKNIAVDLRDNTGGNSTVIDEFMKYIDVNSYKWFKTEARYGNHILPSSQNRSNKSKHNISERYDGNIYVLTSNKTFSSAMMFSVTLQDNDLAKVIGQPSGNKPTSYGDVINFSLPNSKLFLSVSYKKFTRPNSLLNDEMYQKVDFNCDSRDATNEYYKIIKNND